MIPGEFGFASGSAKWAFRTVEAARVGMLG
jgi:hypothetical protein